MTSLLSGRGLWIGAGDARGNRRIFTRESWSLLCQQSVSWGMSVIHPKVADGVSLWYSTTDLQMLRTVASSHNLALVPYTWCYGNTYGRLDEEARIAAAVGRMCGAVSPDIESQWENHPEWAIRFGKILRSLFSGEVYPTVFANPWQHPLPYVEMAQWSQGFLPQVYFSEWNPQTSAHATLYVEPQWQSLSHSLTLHGVPPCFMYPIISLGNRLPPAEVSCWLHTMGHYGYCGFWYDDTIHPYISTILQSPEPRNPYYDVVTPEEQEEEEDDMAVYPEQTLSEGEQKIYWLSSNDQMTWNPTTGIYKKWLEMITKYPGIDLGAPLHNEKAVDLDGEKVTYITFTSGRRIIWSIKEGKAKLF